MKPRPTIVPYRGFGTDEVLWLRGRVILGEAVHPARATDTAFDNMRAMIRRFRSRPVEGASVRVSFGDHVVTATTGARGHFEVTLPATGQPREAEHAWELGKVELVAPAPSDGAQSEAAALVLVPPASATHAVVSDLDDTVLYTYAFSKLRMLRQVLFKNAHTRLPFAGVASFYRALEAGRDGDAKNPIFYVSSSAWALYDLLHEFMRQHGIPDGPILLRDLPFTRKALFAKNRHEHKKTRIEELLRAYPDLSFVLIGDTGQKDAELYTRTALEHPGRIAAIYLRDVGIHPVRHAAIEAMGEPVRAAGTHFLTVKDTLEAAKHAAEQGYIAERALLEISADTRADRLLPG